MPKKRRDPFLTVLDYFTEAPLEAAKIALTLATDKVQQRMVETGEIKPVKAKKKVDKRTPTTYEKLAPLVRDEEGKVIP